ncbi:MAG: long-chain fatty acid--CoA ligase [Tenacibaculum sp.]|nr:long-chain fatty acid--CoA ligase [Tenacibaculum sp.]
MENHLGKLMLNRMEKYADKVMMRIKEGEAWKNFTGKECVNFFKSVANNLLLEEVQHQEKIGIFSQNMPEWTFVDVGAILIGAVPVPIYATNIDIQAKYIVKDSEIKILFVGEKHQYNEVLKFIDDDDVSLQKVVVFDETVPLTHPKSVYFSDWVTRDTTKVNGLYEEREKQLNEKDLATIIYTSGTTGEPKGVMLNHKNITSTFINHDLKYNLTDKDSSLAFLPLSHVFERLWSFYVFHRGMMNTYNKDPKKIAEALLSAKPTVMCSVPRLYEKMHHLIYTNLLKTSFIKRGLFKWCISVGNKFEQNILKNKPQSFLIKLQHKIADKLVFSKIRERLGGNLKFMPCGGAFLSEEITLFFRAVGLPIVMGYGLTETSATVSSFGLNDYTLGTVGQPMPNISVKIGDNDEILIKSATVMQGYYKKPEETEKVFENGWFKTGDAGKIDEKGNIIITDRIKDLMKTSGGKYIAPQHVENVLISHSFIEQVIVVGEGKPYASALLVPNFEALTDWAKYKGIEFKNNDDLIVKEEVINKYQRIVDSAQECLAKFEQIKKFTLMPTEFTMENNEITPTFKPKRNVISSRYNDVIEKMYSA